MLFAAILANPRATGIPLAAAEPMIYSWSKLPLTGDPSVIRASLAATLVLASVAVASANDSIGHLSAGGIVFGRTADIEMRSEDLYVSVNEIRVRYRFFNTSDKDITTLVAFPMPDLPAPSDADSRNVPVEGSPNFMGFKTQVDGKAVDMQVEQRAVALGIDRSDLLKGLNVPLAPFNDATTNAARALPPEKQAELVALGVLRSDVYDIGQGMKAHIHPNWTLRTTYHWTQVFPSRKEIVVEHQYKPSVGASVETGVGSPNADAGEREDYRKRYCMDAEFTAAVQRARAALKRGAQGKPLSEKRLEYILTTGSNWAGPIKDFRLVIDKGAPGNLISACGKFKKISPTQFEWRQADFFPQSNLEVLILEPLQ